MMAEQVEAEEQEHHHPVAINQAAMMAVVSGDSDAADLSDDQLLESANSSSDDEEGDIFADAPTPGDAKYLYDENLDDEDAAYVYQHLRGGRGDEVVVPAKTAGRRGRRTTNASNPVSNKDTTSKDLLTTNKSSTDNITPPRQNNANHDDENKSNETLQAQMKARNSDAVLSCPCCFNIVCMDCQRHARFHNQYRAMFVMGIAVDWNHTLVYDDKVQGLVRTTTVVGNKITPAIATTNDHTTTAVNNTNNTQPTSLSTRHIPSDEDDKNTIYYAVSCANCHTMVAALDMTEEVYHFYDCLASA